jgi:hypothetical protein
MTQPLVKPVGTVDQIPTSQSFPKGHPGTGYHIIVGITNCMHEGHSDRLIIVVSEIAIDGLQQNLALSVIDGPGGLELPVSVKVPVGGMLHP